MLAIVNPFNIFLNWFSGALHQNCSSYQFADEFAFSLISSSCCFRFAKGTFSIACREGGTKKRVATLSTKSKGLQ